MDTEPTAAPASAATTRAERPHTSWGLSIAGGAFAYGVLGTIGAHPFWAGWIGAATVAAIRLSRPEPAAWLLRWLEDRLLLPEDAKKSPTMLIIGIFLLPLLALYSAVAGVAEPTDVWNPGALAITSLGAALVYAFAHYHGTGERAARWWPFWLVLAVVIGSFVLVGGPFRTRWSYCESRLTAAVAAGEDISTANTGRFCWHDAVERTVDGERRLYFDGGEQDDNGKGLVLSTDRSIEHAAGIRYLRRLTNGWYYFETGSVVHGYWANG